MASNKLFRELMQIRGLSINTQKRYFDQVQKLIEFAKSEPNHVIITTELIEQYLIKLKQKGKSASTLRIAWHSISFYCQYVLKRPELMATIPRIRKDRMSVDRVLKKNDIQAIFQAVENRRNRVILKLIYSSGLRISEAVRLKVSDIQSNSKRIYVRHSKNNKDRYTILSTTLLEELRQYWLWYKPTSYLFPSCRCVGRPISTASVQSAFKKAVQIAGITKDVSVHYLRHSFATHLLDNGTDIFTISKLLGHSSIKTTVIYLSMTETGFSKVVSPLDL